MRIVFEIPGEQVKTTVFHWNQKYLIKFETALYEQTYKVSELDVMGDEDIRRLIDDETFQATWIKQFQSMHQGLQEAIGRM
jgi:hypothetical protein